MVFLSDIARVPVVYKRPSEWLALPALTDGAQMVKAIFPGNNFFTLRVVSTGNFTVNWGDGNTISYASGTTVSYNYDYSTVSAATEFRGYRQVLIQVTGTAITTFNLALKHISTAGGIGHDSGILDIQLQLPSCNSLVISNGNTNVQYHKMLERVYIGNNVSTTYASVLAGCTSLRQAIVWIPSNSVSFAALFNGCNVLTDLRFIGDTTNARVTALDNLLETVSC